MRESGPMSPNSAQDSPTKIPLSTPRRVLAPTQDTTQHPLVSPTPPVNQKCSTRQSVWADWPVRLPPLRPECLVSDDHADVAATATNRNTGIKVVVSAKTASQAVIIANCASALCLRARRPVCEESGVLDTRQSTTSYNGRCNSALSCESQQWT